METSNKKIAKNALFMYFRMALVILVGLYTSRVILNALGVEDFGIYNVAGSVVAMFTFLNGALGTSSSRFITVELGKASYNDISHLENCFKTTRGIHAIMGVLIVLIAETIGLWLLYYKCDIPDDRMTSALIVYQISVITAYLSVTLVPFQALLIAHEHMTVYAYLGIIDAFFKLGICYLILISPIDNLVFYALLLFGVQLFDNIFNRIYCKRHFRECSLKYSLDKKFFKPILGFTGWNLLGSFSTMAMNQAATVMISFFFGPSVVAARAISGQVRGQVMNFVNNFRTAVNPQIIKRYAGGEVESSKSLLFLSTKLSFYLMLLIAIPLLMETEFILRAWLKIVPQYAIEFVQITLLEMLFVVYDISFYIIFQSTGRLKENALACPSMDIIAFILVFVIYSFGGSVLTIAYALLILTISQGMLVKPYLAVRLFDYKWHEFRKLFAQNGLVLIAALSISIILKSCLYNKINEFLVLGFEVVLVLLCILFCGLNKHERNKILSSLRIILKKVYNS